MTEVHFGVALENRLVGWWYIVEPSGIVDHRHPHKDWRW